MVCTVWWFVLSDGLYPLMVCIVRWFALSSSLHRLMVCITRSTAYMVMELVCCFLLSDSLHRLLMELVCRPIRLLSVFSIDIGKACSIRPIEKQTGKTGNRRWYYRLQLDCRVFHLDRTFWTENFRLKILFLVSNPTFRAKFFLPLFSENFSLKTILIRRQQWRTPDNWRWQAPIGTDFKVEPDISPKWFSNAADLSVESPNGSHAHCFGWKLTLVEI